VILCLPFVKIDVDVVVVLLLLLPVVADDDDDVALE
jgi:hypothetical protein